MGFRSPGPENNDENEDAELYSRIDPETIARIDNALKGTIEVDVANLSPDDKLTLLIDRYNRKMRELQQLKNTNS